MQFNPLRSFLNRQRRGRGAAFFDMFVTLHRG
jgi:hypothetical protein